MEQLAGHEPYGTGIKAGKDLRLFDTVSDLFFFDNTSRSMAATHSFAATHGLSPCSFVEGNASIDGWMDGDDWWEFHFSACGFSDCAPDLVACRIVSTMTATVFNNDSSSHSFERATNGLTIRQQIHQTRLTNVDNALDGTILSDFTFIDCMNEEESQSHANPNDVNVTGTFNVTQNSASQCLPSPYSVCRVLETVPSKQACTRPHTHFFVSSDSVVIPDLSPNSPFLELCLLSSHSQPYQTLGRKEMLLKATRKGVSQKQHPHMLFGGRDVCGASDSAETRASVGVVGWNHCRDGRSTRTGCVDEMAKNSTEHKTHLSQSRLTPPALVATFSFPYLPLLPNRHWAPATLLNCF
ncbi:hypothetical protein BLNAU_1575 [Blattamonas nauphoetae]|uniref:Uncharacterized protein n=1 Tax=Blattamonas nauphoetae TaxID=2049346 RepID=A0ABQ9YIE3_9EUKA|nr:hypothetical protein BLNAU_1575 [Blattamonas nauphoetae]